MDQASPSVLAYYKRSKTGQLEGMGTWLGNTARVDLHVQCLGPAFHCLRAVKLIGGGGGGGCMEDYILTLVFVTCSTIILVHSRAHNTERSNLHANFVLQGTCQAFCWCQQQEGGRGLGNKVTTGYSLTQ